MIVWTDAQLSPAIAPWLRATFGVEAFPVRELGLREAEDSVIFAAARAAGAVVLTKDADFVDLLSRNGPPPQLLWLTCGNTSNAALRRLLIAAWPRVVEWLDRHEPLIELSDSVAGGS